ncbi:transcription factor bHLH145-like [Hibiscus syriacus]|uniref:transcription factor bHLH145-like n=1 Tax=Hibiscus syriacus TaxID=106335 RepID=UPI0019221CCD|nr:transcription factor bHLH145-like [Hibiscus syriacus]
MREGCGSGFPQLRFDWQSPNLNSSPAPPAFGLQSSNPPFMNFGTNTRTSPVHANPELSYLQVSQGNESRGWSYCLPRFRLAFALASNSFLKEQPLANPCENCKGSGIPKEGSGVAENRFLVFDQSGDQTTLIFCSAFGTSTKGLTSWGPKSPVAGNFNGEDPIAKLSGNIHSGPISKDIFDEDGIDVQSEMHEDTEELDALLYSDDDDSEYTEDEEVMSTGYSPNTMTGQDEQFEGSCKEAATRVTKKRKLLDGSINSLLAMDTANDAVYGDDADSSCDSGQNPGSSGNMDSSSGNKRIRRDKIRETVSVLRSIIPGVEGKDAVAVLDEAIDYLKSLKYKAKTSGFGTL